MVHKDDSMILCVAGYVVYTRGHFKGGNIIKMLFSFRTEMRNGVLFFAHGGRNVYFLVQLVNGSVHVEFNDGTERSRVIYPNTGIVTTCDGKWHSVHIAKRNQLLAMELDGNHQTIVRYGNYTVIRGLVIDSDLYIGGIKPGPETDDFIKTFDIPVQGSMLHL